MTRCILQLCVLVVFLCGTQHHAQAVQWQALNGTTRYKVAYDKQSVRLTSWDDWKYGSVLFPGERQIVKSAAAEYKDKRYRSHLEYYEIDCSEQTALLGLIDILGASRARIKRLAGRHSARPDIARVCA